jgi:hypothetical protein
MKLIIYAKRFGIVVMTLALVLIANMEASANSNLDRELRSAIAKVRSAKTVAHRLAAAEHLLALTDKRDCSSVTDDTIHSLISLLDIDDDGVRMWVAATLGVFGMRARGAAPKLLTIYSVSACIVSDQGSDATIPIALKNMGVAVPHPDCIPR